MDETIKKIAFEALELQKKIKLDQEKLRLLKEKIILASEGKNSSYAIKLLAGTIRITKSKKLVSYLLDNKGFEKLNLQTKKKLLQTRINGKKILKFKFLIKPNEYKELLSQNLVPDELKGLVLEKNRKPFYVSIFLGKKSAPKEMTEEEEIAFMNEIYDIQNRDDAPENEEEDEDKEDDLYDIMTDPEKVMRDIEEEDPEDDYN